VKEATEFASFVFKWLFLIALGFNIIFSGGMKYMMIMIRSLQMILHMPMIQTAHPANVVMVIKIVIPIA
jgi:hypothetical protein